MVCRSDFLAVAGAAALLTAAATASASASTTKLDSATESGWDLYIATPTAVSGTSYEFQEPGTNECAGSSGS